MIHEPSRGFTNLPNPADVADTARIIELFHKTDYAGELLANGNILYDGVEMTPKRWKRERSSRRARRAANSPPVCCDMQQD